jgi:hypothetical protein
MVLLAFLFISIPLLHVWDTNTHPQHLKQNMVAFEWDNSNFINDKDDKKLSMIPPIPFWGIQIVSFTSQLLLLIFSAAYIPTMKHRFIRPVFCQSNYLSISLIFNQKFNEKRSGIDVVSLFDDWFLVIRSNSNICISGFSYIQSIFRLLQ